MLVLGLKANSAGLGMSGLSFVLTTLAWINWYKFQGQKYII